MEASVIVEEGGLLEDLVKQGGAVGGWAGGLVGMAVELVDSSPVGRVGRIIPRTGEAALSLGTLENPDSQTPDMKLKLKCFQFDILITFCFKLEISYPVKTQAFLSHARVSSLLFRLTDNNSKDIVLKISNAKFYPDLQHDIFRILRQF